MCLQEKVEEICRQLRDGGFNGVPFSAVQVQDVEAPGDRFILTPEQFADLRRDRAGFIAEPDPLFIRQVMSMISVDAAFDRERFCRELAEHVQQTCGDDVDVFCCVGRYEFRVRRKPEAAVSCWN